MLTPRPCAPLLPSAIPPRGRPVAGLSALGAVEKMDRSRPARAVRGQPPLAALLSRAARK
jgi:hypothetical protein